MTCPVDDPTPLPDAELDLDRLPPRFLGRVPLGIRVLVGGKMGDLGPGAGCDGPIAKVARDVRVRGDDDPPLLVDFKAGFEDSARGVLTGLDWAVVVVDPTTASIHMAIHMKQMVKKIQEGVPPATAHLLDPHLVELARQQFKESRIQGMVAILNRVPDPETEAFLRGRLEALGGPRVIGVLPEDRFDPDPMVAGRRGSSGGIGREGPLNCPGPGGPGPGPSCPSRRSVEQGRFEVGGSRRISRRSERASDSFHPAPATG